MVLLVEKTRESVVPVRSGVFISDETMIREYIAKEHQWINKMQTLIEKAKLEAEDYVSWAAYHAIQQPETNTPTSNVALLPLFRDNAHTTCMIKHAMDVVSKAVKHGLILIYIYKTTSEPILVLLSQNAQSYPLAAVLYLLSVRLLYMSLHHVHVHLSTILHALIFAAPHKRTGTPPLTR